jgi:integrase
MASVRKRFGNWQAQVRRAGQKTLSRTFEKKAEAVAWARSKEAELDGAERPEEVVELFCTTLGDLIERYRDTVTPTKKSVRQETYRLNRLLRHPIAKLTLDRLTTGVFARYRDERLKTVGSQQVRHDLNAFAVVLRTARLDWDVPLKVIPLDSVRRPKMPQGRSRRLGGDEYERLRRAAEEGPTPYIWAVVEFAIETAMRQSEILGLHWHHIDFGRRIAHLPDTKNGYSRDVPLTSVAIRVLGEQRRANFASPFPHTVRMVQWAWKQTTRRAQVEDLHFHDLRHEAISRLFEKGLSIPEVAVVSGHRDFRMLSRYTHLKASDVGKKLT